MKRLRTTISAVLSIALAAFSFPALGAESGKIPAEDAITIVRTAIDIPTELTEFSYDDYENGYNLHWSDENYNRNINATVNKDGVIIGYDSYGGYDEKGLSPYTKGELWQKAAAFLNRVVPDLAGSMVIDEDSSTSRRAEFDRYENGIQVEGNGATIFLNRVSGEVTSYNLNWDFENSFSAESPVTVEAAKAALVSGAVDLQYETFWPMTVEAGTETKPQAIPVYIHRENIRVNALTGECFERSYYREGSLYGMNQMSTEDAVSTSGAGDGGGSGYKLMEQEIAAIQSMSNLITKDQIKEKLNALSELWLPAEYELSVNYYSSVTKDSTAYTASARCEWKDENGETATARINLNAETGEIESVDIYVDNMYSSPENPISDEECIKTAESFINKIKSMDGYRVNENTYAYGGKAAKNQSYVRYIGDIPYPDDSRSVTVSRRSGKVTNYSEYSPKSEIITPASMISAEQAVDENFTVEKIYSYNDENKPVLSYTLVPKGEFYSVKAENGSRIDYSGEIVRDKGKKADETEHWAWKVFDILRQNDIYIEGDYSLNDNISSDNFLTLVNMAMRISDVPYRYYYSYDEATVASVDAQKNTDVPSREGAAELIMKAMGWEKLINLDIYSVEFADSAEFVSGTGGAAILKGLGLMSDENGYFYPNRSLTYGEAYSIVYNIANMYDDSESGVMPLIAG